MNRVITVAVLLGLVAVALSVGALMLMVWQAENPFIGTWEATEEFSENNGEVTCSSREAIRFHFQDEATLEMSYAFTVECDGDPFPPYDSATPEFRSDTMLYQWDAAQETLVFVDPTTGQGGPIFYRFHSWWRRDAFDVFDLESGASVTFHRIQ